MFNLIKKPIPFEIGEREIIVSLQGRSTDVGKIVYDNPTDGSPSALALRLASQLEGIDPQTARKISEIMNEVAAAANGGD